MSVRIPNDASQNVQNAFRDVEQELAGLKAALYAQSSIPSDGDEIKALKDRLDRAPLLHDFSSDKNVFVSSGTQHAAGLVPDPGSTVDAEPVLHEQGWGYPARGLVRSVTTLGAVGDTQYGADVVDVLGSLKVLGGFSADSALVRDLNVYGTHNITATAAGVTGASVYNSGAQALTQNAWNDLTFDSERWDNGGCHSTSSDTNRITVPTGKDGIWLFGGNIYPGATEMFYKVVHSGGGASEVYNPTQGRCGAVMFVNAVAGGYFYSQAYPTSASISTVASVTNFWAVFLGLAS